MLGTFSLIFLFVLSFVFKKKKHFIHNKWRTKLPGINKKCIQKEVVVYFVSQIESYINKSIMSEPALKKKPAEVQHLRGFIHKYLNQSSICYVVGDSAFRVDGITIYAKRTKATSVKGVFSSVAFSAKTIEMSYI